MDFDKILEVIKTERDYQDKKYGGTVHDKQHTLSEWIFFIRTYINDAEKALYDENEEEAKNAIRKITALGIAVMEVIDIPKRND